MGERMIVGAIGAPFGRQDGAVLGLRLERRFLT
jgi:hypothetical protein